MQYKTIKEKDISLPQKIEDTPIEKNISNNIDIEQITRLLLDSPPIWVDKLSIYPLELDITTKVAQLVAKIILEDGISSFDDTLINFFDIYGNDSFPSYSHFLLKLFPKDLFDIYTIVKDGINGCFMKPSDFGHHVDTMDLFYRSIFLNILLVINSKYSISSNNISLKILNVGGIHDKST